MNNQRTPEQWRSRFKNLADYYRTIVGTDVPHVASPKTLELLVRDFDQAAAFVDELLQMRAGVGHLRDRVNSIVEKLAAQHEQLELKGAFEPEMCNVYRTAGEGMERCRWTKGHAGDHAFLPWSSRTS